jgi:error-prone DNA polymerase
MKHLRSVLAPNGVLNTAQIAKARDGDRVAVAGLVICRQRPHTAHGFVFVTLEDETGMLNVVIPPTVFEKQRLLIARTPLLMVRGELQVEGLVVNIKAVECEAIHATAGRHARSHDFH